MNRTPAQRMRLDGSQSIEPVSCSELALTQTINGRNSHGGPREEDQRARVVPVQHHVPICLMRRRDGLHNLHDQERIDWKSYDKHESLTNTAGVYRT